MEYYCYSFQIYCISVKLCDKLGTVSWHRNLTTNYNIVSSDNPVPSTSLKTFADISFVNEEFTVHLCKPTQLPNVRQKKSYTKVILTWFPAINMNNSNPPSWNFDYGH